MPPQNAVELVPTKSGTETPKNGNLNNNNTKAGALAKLDLKLTEEVPEPTKATIIIPPDGGFGWVVMVSVKTKNILDFRPKTSFPQLSSQVSVATRLWTVLCSVRACSLNQLFLIWEPAKLQLL